MKLTWQHLVLIAILIAAVLGSQLLGGKDSTIVVIVTTVLAAIFGPKLAADQAAGKQNEQLDQIEHAANTAVKQTNGVLDQRIRDGVAAALLAHGLAVDQPAAKHAAPEQDQPPAGETLANN